MDQGCDFKEYCVKSSPLSSAGFQTFRKEKKNKREKGEILCYQYVQNFRGDIDMPLIS